MDPLTIVAILSWGVVVGIIFSAIGAAGGILTSFVLITLFGVLEPNSVKPMIQLEVQAAALILVRAICAALHWSGRLACCWGWAAGWSGLALAARFPAVTCRTWPHSVHFSGR